MKRLLNILNTTGPFLIIGALLYAGFFVKPASSGVDLVRPVFERGDRLYGLAMQPSGKSWLVGGDGKILASSDGGRSWHYDPSPVTQSLQDVAAWDDSRAVAVGDGGVVVRTEDGGKSWQKVDVPTSRIANKLMSVKAIPGGRGWAVGEGGSALKTIDFGKTWVKALNAEEDTAWNDVFFVDANGWIVGERGRILVSGDGGESWREVSSPVKSSLMSVAFKSASAGVAVGIDGVILVTGDGGNSWRTKTYSAPQGSTAEPKPLASAAAATQAGGVKSGSLGGAAAVDASQRVPHLFRVTWGAPRWIASGAKGVVVVSEDGDTWVGMRLSAEDRSWYTAIVQRGNQYFLSGARFTSVPINELGGRKPS